MVYCGCLFCEIKILPIYSPIIPSDISCIPAKMKIAVIVNENPAGRFGSKKCSRIEYIPNKNPVRAKNNPIKIEILSGITEKLVNIFDHNLINFNSV